MRQLHAAAQRRFIKATLIKSESIGRPPIGLEHMLRIHFIQNWFNLADFAVIKRLWGLTKVSYRGLVKNAGRAFPVLALANIYLSRNRIMAPVCP